MTASYPEDVLEAAHKQSMPNRESLRKSTRFGCFFCLHVQDVSAIQEWGDNGNTALCPNCKIDSVIGDATGLPVTDRSFLSAMHARWF